MKAIPVRSIHEKTREPVLSGSFSIRTLEEISAGAAIEETLHRHDFFYILVIRQSSGSHEIDFVQHRVENNAVFLMRPGQVHRLLLERESKGYLIQFRDEFFNAYNLPLKELLRKVSHKKLCTVEESRFDRVTAACKQMLAEYSGQEEGFEEIIRAGLLIFFTELLRNRKSKAAKPEDANGYSQEKLEMFIDLLDKNITVSKQVSYYVEKLNLSAYQLGAITKSLLNKTPSDVINGHIILESKRRLLATSSQVNQIAYDLGYDDPSYFIRFFKKHTGQSPESFRNTSK